MVTTKAVTSRAGMAVTTANRVATNREDTVVMTASREVISKEDTNREVMVVTVSKAATNKVAKVAINMAVMEAVLAAVLQTPTSLRTSSTRDLPDTATKVLLPITKVRVNSAAQTDLMVPMASEA